MFLVTAILVTYVFSTAAATYRYFWIDFDPNPAIAALVDAGLPSDTHSLNIHTSDGEKLIAWHVPRKDHPLILYLHGDGGNLASNHSRARGLVAAGFALLAPEYRGYGGSTGSPTEGGLYLDADAAYLKALELGYAPERIALLGESYGSGVALNLAARRRVAAVAIEGAYATAADTIADRFWGFPVRLIMRNAVRSDRVVRDVRAPLLVIHGERDSIIPIKYAQRLFAAANEPKQFVGIPNEDHLALKDKANLKYVTEWLWRQFGERTKETPP